MEEYIQFIVFIVVALLYNLFGASNKKKKQAPKPKKRPQRPQNRPQVSNKPLPQKSPMEIFAELTGKTNMANTFQTQKKPDPYYTDQEGHSLEGKSLEYIPKPTTMNDPYAYKKKRKKPTKLVKPQKAAKRKPTIRFEDAADLKKAFILSEIFQRKF